MAVTPDTTILPENRSALEALIEAAIARLDEVDPDPDLEDSGDDEPWLGAPEHVTGSWRGLYPTDHDDDREQDCKNEGAQCEDEGAIETECACDEDDPGGLWWYGHFRAAAEYPSVEIVGELRVRP